MQPLSIGLGLRVCRVFRVMVHLGARCILATVIYLHVEFICIYVYVVYPIIWAFSPRPHSLTSDGYFSA